jgi:hypothetical protein
MYSRQIVLLIMAGLLAACSGSRPKPVAVSSPAIVSRSTRQIREENDARRYHEVIASPPCRMIPPPVDITGWQIDSHLTAIRLPVGFKRDTQPDPAARSHHGGVRWREGGRTFRLAVGFWAGGGSNTCRTMFGSEPYLVAQFVDTSGHITLSAYPADTAFRMTTLMAGTVETPADVALLWTIFRFAAGWDYDPRQGILRASIKATH